MIRAANDPSVFIFMEKSHITAFSVIHRLIVCSSSVPLDEAEVDGEGGEDDGHPHPGLHGLHDGGEDKDEQRHGEVHAGEHQVHSTHRECGGF